MLVLVIVLGVLLTASVLFSCRSKSWNLDPEKLLAARMAATAKPSAPVEKDVEDWGVVRALEREVYGHYYHRMDGTTNACGWEPVGELTVAGDYARTVADAADYVGRRTQNSITRREDMRERVQLPNEILDYGRMVTANVSMPVHLADGMMVGPGVVAVPPEMYDHLKKLGYLLDDPPPGVRKKYENITVEDVRNMAPAEFARLRSDWEREQIGSSPWAGPIPYHGE